MKKWFWLAAALPLMLAGCDLFNRDFTQTDDSGKGAIVLFLDSSTIPTKTIAPGNLTPTNYSIVMTHATAGTITESGWTTGVYTKNGMATGAWTVKITAYSGATPIGAIGGGVAGVDYADFAINAGQVTPVTVKVIPLVGQGNLALRLAWDEGVLTRPVTVEAWLVPEGETLSESHKISSGFTVVDETTDPGYVDRFFASYSTTNLAARYYTLVMQVLGNGTLAWGWAESVRIVAGMNTDGTNLQLVSGTGGVSMTINVDMENPYTVNLTGQKAIYTNTEAIQITANPGSPQAGHAFSYQWYLNGQAIATGAALNYGPIATDGQYAVCVVVTETNTLTSAIRTISSSGVNFVVQ